MEKVTIGSTAMRHWFPDFNREPKDVDYAVFTQEEHGSNREIEHLYNPVIPDFPQFVQDGFLTPEGLLTLKMSHIFWDINWRKHMFDIQFLLDKGVCYDHDFFLALYEFWEEHHKNLRRRKSDLNMSAKDFFTNAINYDEIEHDALHELINPEPLYKSILKDGEEVLTCEHKYAALDDETKLEVIREEVMVMAYERYKDKFYLVAFNKMLDKFIRDHAPMWMAIFAIHNYKKLIKAKFDFIEHLDKALEKQNAHNNEDSTGNH